MEIKIYVIEPLFEFKISPILWDNELFMNQAEMQGGVYSLDGFVIAFNNKEFDKQDSFIRII